MSTQQIPQLPKKSFHSIHLSLPPKELQSSTLSLPVTFFTILDFAKS